MLILGIGDGPGAGIVGQGVDTNARVIEIVVTKVLARRGVGKRQTAGWMKTPLGRPRQWPFPLLPPRLGALYEDRDRGLPVDSVLLPLQPAVPPAVDLTDEI